MSSWRGYHLIVVEGVFLECGCFFFCFVFVGCWFVFWVVFLFWLVLWVFFGLVYGCFVRVL